MLKLSAASLRFRGAPLVKSKKPSSVHTKSFLSLPPSSRFISNLSFFHTEAKQHTDFDQGNASRRKHERFFDNSTKMIPLLVCLVALSGNLFVWREQKQIQGELKDIQVHREKESTLEMARSHQPFYVDQVEKYLREPYVAKNYMVGDIPGLNFVARDPQRITDLKRILSSVGGLTLLEGPSGSGKTTTVQHSLHDMKQAGVYFAVRDDSCGLPPFIEFARAFGITELPLHLSSSVLEILRVALENLKTKNPTAPPPILVIDDVQQLLKPPSKHEGEMILAWCLGRAANQQLTVLFISPEPIQHVMKEQSGYIARLSTQSTPFEYIDSSILKSALLKVDRPDLSFLPLEVEEVINVLGTHMSDIRALQRMRIERNMSVEEALQELVKEEARALKNLFISQRAMSIDFRQRQLQHVMCKHVATASSRVVALEDLRKSVELELMDTQLNVSTVVDIVDQLVNLRIFRRCFINNGLGYGVAFHRPLKRAAFKELLKDKEFMQFQYENE